MKYSLNFIIGIFIGFGAILPGVSSGVFCVIFGIYEKLVDSIVNFFKDIRKNISFLLPIFLGAIVGIVLFGNVIKYFFTKYNTLSCFAFIGLILGTVPALFKQASSDTSNDKSVSALICSDSKKHKQIYNIQCFNVRKIIPMLISFFIGIFLILIEKHFNVNFAAGSISNNLFYLVFAGFLMSVGIVVPGISNTVILMCLGVYSVYISAIASFNLYILIPMGLGVLVGGIIWLKLIKFFLNKYHQSTFYAIIGFTLGSIFVLYPGISFNLEGLFSIILLVLSTIFSYKLANLE